VKIIGNKVVKKTYSILGNIVIALGFVFFFVFPFILVSDVSESNPQDIFGFAVPQPPIWTSYIPYIGWVIGRLFEFFSLHGLVYILITGTLISVGNKLLDISKSK
jgi:hypothetical protein